MSWQEKLSEPICTVPILDGTDEFALDTPSWAAFEALQAQDDAFGDEDATQRLAATRHAVDAIVAASVVETTRDEILRLMQRNTAEENTQLGFFATAICNGSKDPQALWDARDLPEEEQPPIAEPSTKKK